MLLESLQSSMSVSVKREEERLAQELVEGEIKSVELSYPRDNCCYNCGITDLKMRGCIGDMVGT